MVIKKYFSFLVVAISLSSCNFLDFDESQGVTQEQAYATFTNIQEQASAIYRKLPSDYGVIGGALREAATDNAVYTWNNNAVYDIYTNKWTPINTIDDQWAGYYELIYDANLFLENYTEEALEIFKWDKEYEDNLKRARMQLNEVKILRAPYHFELAKRYGDIPLMKRTYQLNEINQVEKTPFQDVIDFIVAECTEIGPKLPITYTEFFGQTGRVTHGAALALKSRALLYAASPLFVDEGKKSIMWEKAADAAYEVIKLGCYQLPKIDKDPLYVQNGGNDVLTSPQLIFESRGGSSSSFEQTNLPIGFAEGTNSGNTPTQNLVDDFEMKDGTPFDWNNQEHVANMYYDKNGNKTRDPRFYINVICNGMTFMKTLVETFEGGKYGYPLEGATLTGYYLKKLVNETVSLDPVKPVSKNHHYPSYRYAEVLLNYAEAMNEWQGPDYTDNKHPISARIALNQVRTAASMQDVVAANQTDFRNKVRKERRIELAFEDHRFWDIRRWKEGEVVKKIYGVKIKNENGVYSYKKEEIQSRTWENKMYLYPIPQKETYVNANLTQNPGW